MELNGNRSEELQNFIKLNEKNRDIVVRLAILPS